MGDWCGSESGYNGVMRVQWISAGVATDARVEDLATLKDRDDGFVWLDVPVVDQVATKVLNQVFGFHPLAVRTCQERSAVPKVHAYKDHFFCLLMCAEPAGAGELTIYGLGQFISLTFLVTVHEPVAAGESDLAARDIAQISERVTTGRLRPRTPGELAHAIVSGFARRMDTRMAELATQVARLEREVMRGDTSGADAILSDMLAVRHELLTIRTIAVQSREVYARMAALSRGLPEDVTVWLDDLLDHFERLANVCDGEKELLNEVLDLFQTRVSNELNAFVRRLTSVGAILVADTLIAGIYGMNFRNMPELDWRFGYPFALLLMATTSVALAVYFRRKRWL